MFLVRNPGKIRRFHRYFSSFVYSTRAVCNYNLFSSLSTCAHATATKLPAWNGSVHILSGSSRPSIADNHNTVQIRWHSTDEHQHPTRKVKKPLTLMDFPQLVWPSVVKTIRNFIMVHFIIRPYFDRDFHLPDFVIGAKHALQVVSSALAGAETKQLEGLVDRVALNDVKQSLSKMSVAERYDIRVDKEDVYFSFPYQIGVMFDESEDDSQKRFVEITMVFHVLRGLKGMIERGETVPLNIGALPEYRDKISICNYRFIKEFTKGVESDWTVNVINHFRPSDYIDE
ncbi:m-AAA protease-interacting protein 1, mitochondrial-like [Anopheles albimanus]|uniref:m-AAA protease-interacting protein 1, mitochondrial-like n=1 Tax=Anopheles albimanus TaxID=7167 RepID=UPI00163FBEEF|nr:m-AAA protease-interacting protein 1, mitochondrial-like [Anopheles albimanus]